MCGIAGILSLDGSEVLQGRHLHQMTDQMKNRGPDDEGFVLVQKNGTIYTYYGQDTPTLNNQSFQPPGYPKYDIVKSYTTIST